MSPTAAFTLKLDDNLSAIRVTDAKVEARTLFLGKDVLPKPGGSNPLREAWHGGYAIEIFYFAASSLNITNIFRYVRLLRKLQVCVRSLAFVIEGFVRAWAQWLKRSHPVGEGEHQR